MHCTAWTCDAEHYTAVFITWTAKNEVVHDMLICCGVQDEHERRNSWELDEEKYANEIKFNAQSIIDYIEMKLQEVGLSIYEHIDFICGDNCSTNKCMAKKVTEAIALQFEGDLAYTVPLVGCASHRLNLAQQSLYLTAGRKVLVDKVDKLMGQLKTLKNGSTLRKLSDHLPQRKQDTRWGSTDTMLKKYVKIRHVIVAPTDGNPGFGQDVLQFLPNYGEDVFIDKMLQDIDVVESASNALQRSGSKRLTLYEARALCDNLSQMDHSYRTYLSPDAAIVHDKNFENAIVKVQKGLESQLTAEEIKAVKRFFIPTQTDQQIDSSSSNSAASAASSSSSSSSSSSAVGNSLHTADEVIEEVQERRAKQQRVWVSAYRFTNHVSPTSNIVERLFSRAKLIMRPHRKHMSPWNLELLLLLRFNKVLWGAQTIQQIIEETTVQSAAVAHERVLAAQEAAAAATAALTAATAIAETIAAAQTVHVNGDNR